MNKDTLRTFIDDLSHRLPELTWKLGLLYSIIPSHALPKGLFKQALESTPASCIREIKDELSVLGQQESERGRQYLAQRIHQKINVLVRLCQRERTASTIVKAKTFGVQSLSTRQQWLEALSEDVEILRAQQQALVARLTYLQEASAVLSLKSELGEVERSLTLAKETLMRATLF